MKNKFLGIALLGLLALTGCGNDSDDGGYNGIYQGNLGVQGYCTPEIVDAYNNFARMCNAIQGNMGFNQREVQHCRQAALLFVNKYPNVSCVAAINGGNQWGNPNGWRYNDQFNTQFQGQQAMVISSQPMQQVLASLGQFQGGNRGWYNNYPRWRGVRRR
jgi:hypothetical protein